MSTSYDVIVAGLGAMGGAACDHLARRGARVLGLDRHPAPHSHGSSHGESRIIREAYFEDPRYVPIVRRAYECWMELERDSRRALLRMTGGLMIGPLGGALVSGALRSAEQHALPHQLLSAGEARARFPALRIEDPDVAVWEPRAGVLDPEACVTAQLERARKNGATLKDTEPALQWRAEGGGVEVTTPAARYRAEHLVLASGAWLQDLLPGVALPLTIERVAMFWFDPAGVPEAFDSTRLPIWIWEHEVGRFIYGFPSLKRGIKIARHHEGQSCTADTARRDVAAEEVEAMRALIARRVPGAVGELRETATCLYTNTPDGDFIINTHPKHPQTLIVSACSGHGFKFASAIGEVIADVVLEGDSRFDLTPFRIARFSK